MSHTTPRWYLAQVLLHLNSYFFATDSIEEIALPQPIYDLAATCCYRLMTHSKTKVKRVSSRSKNFAKPAQCLRPMK